MTSLLILKSVRYSSCCRSFRIVYSLLSTCTAHISELHSAILHRCAPQRPRIRWTSLQSTSQLFKPAKSLFVMLSYCLLRDSPPELQSCHFAELDWLSSGACSKSDLRLFVNRHLSGTSRRMRKFSRAVDVLADEFRQHVFFFLFSKHLSLLSVFVF